MKMSDFDNFSKTLQKKFYRTKEKVLESIGKADKTKDGDFDSLTAAFNEQHATASKLLKVFRKYSAHMKAMSIVSKNMHQTVSEAYEPSWDGAENFVVATEQMSKLWDDHFANVSETVHFHITSYVGKFPELKNKIAKRNRKLLDYDRARHRLDALESSKKRNDYKIANALRDMDVAQTIYETINFELFEELPALYNSRIPVLSNYFSSFLRSEALFDEESSKIKRQMAELTAGLPKEQNLIASTSSLGTLKAKTLPRREPMKMGQQRGKYSPQLPSKEPYSRGPDRGATLPPRPSSPKVPPFPMQLLPQHQPPPPQEPAPLPPTSTVSSSSWSPPPQEPAPLPPTTSASLSSSASSWSASSSSPLPQKPPQPQFSNPSAPPQQLPQIQVSSTSPPPIPPPPSCQVSVLQSTGPQQQQQQQQQQLNLTAQNIISYVPELTPLAGQQQQQQENVLVPGNPFERDLKSADPDRSGLDAGGNTISEFSNNVDKIGPNGTENVTGSIHSEGHVAEAVVVDTAKEGINLVESASKVVTGVANQIESSKQDVVEVVEGASGEIKKIVENVDQQVSVVEDKLSASVTLGGGSSVTENKQSEPPKSVTIVKDVVDNVAGNILTGGVEVGMNNKGSNNVEIGRSTGRSNFLDSNITTIPEEADCSVVQPDGHYLYRVQATHNYKAADSDEISLEAGDIVHVLPINNKEFEDEGWALGLKQKDGKRGMFPVNFTRKID